MTNTNKVVAAVLIYKEKSCSKALLIRLEVTQSFIIKIPNSFITHAGRGVAVVAGVCPL